MLHFVTLCKYCTCPWIQCICLPKKYKDMIFTTSKALFEQSTMEWFAEQTLLRNRIFKKVPIHPTPTIHNTLLPLPPPPPPQMKIRNKEITCMAWKDWSFKSDQKVLKLVSNFSPCLIMCRISCLYMTVEFKKSQ